MEYTLKDKIQVTKEFLSDLEMKSWQEIENLQNQIANIETTPETAEVIKLLKNLLTSYYVFTGGLESLSDVKTTYKIPETTVKTEVKKEVIPVEPTIEIEATEEETFEPVFANETEQQDFEPFEYFVDFDEPEGDPISDEDLYSN